MIKISNGNNEVIVTKGAFESIFKPQGYKIIEKEKIKIEPSKIEEKSYSKVEETEKKVGNSNVSRKK